MVIINSYRNSRVWRSQVGLETLAYLAVERKYEVVWSDAVDFTFLWVVVSVIFVEFEI